MAVRLRRRNDQLLRWLRAALVALATCVGLLGLHFVPVWGAAALALVAGLLTLASADLGVLTAVVALGLPMLATAPIMGITFIALGIVLLRYVGSNGGQAFIVVALALVGAAFGPVWAAAALAGYLMGTSEGLLAAALAALTVQAFGISLGRAAIGATLTGGTEDLLHLSKMPSSLLDTGWIAPALASISPTAVNETLGAIGRSEHVALLIAQPIIWGCCAIIAATGGQALKRSGRENLAFLAPAFAALVPGLVIVVLAPLLAAEVEMNVVATSAVSSAALAAVIAWAWDRVFSLEAYETVPPAAKTGMAAEDADVDELLSLIAVAEDRLATEHTVTSTVMITDMKSFSRMTEEDGSMITAKAIQRHRDLLLPIIDKHGGHGKSTGGDGLVASFTTPAQAVGAAAEMQALLAAHNASHPDDRELSVRIGVADGEVVLDRNGRPFIGAALNLAARVMNLADGGQAFVSSPVARATRESFSLHSHGAFELKNIADPVEIFEILWAQGQQPRDPRAQPST